MAGTEKGKLLRWCLTSLIPNSYPIPMSVRLNQLEIPNFQASRRREQLGLQGGCDVAPSEQPWDAHLTSQAFLFSSHSCFHVWDFSGSQGEGEGAPSLLSMGCFGRGRSCLSSPVPKSHSWESARQPLCSPSTALSLHLLLHAAGIPFGNAGQLWSCCEVAQARQQPGWATLLSLRSS